MPRNSLKPKLETAAPLSGGCRHHWVLESPNGAKVRGLCRCCGATRQFPTALEPMLWGATYGTFKTSFATNRQSKLNEEVDDE